MRMALKAFVLVLALQVAAGSVLLHAELLPSPANQRPAGCHGHGHQGPQPQPKNFACCMAGHDSAILQASRTAAPACDTQVHVSGDQSDTAAVTHLRENTQQFMSSGDPPPVLPLRI